VLVGVKKLKEKYVLMSENEYDEESTLYLGMSTRRVGYR